MANENPIVDLIDLFGGTAVEMSKILGHGFPSTVQAWKDKGKLPKWRRAEIEMSGVKVPKALLDRCVRGM